jgi:uncharacterized protein (DUF169 family)
MNGADFKETADFIRQNLLLKTLPVAVKFLKDKADFPEKTRQPSVAMGKKVAICQGVTMARSYGWTVGLAKEDMVCVPAMIAFGFTDSPDPPATLAGLFHKIDFSSSEDLAHKETGGMSRFENGEVTAIVLSPLQKGLYEPDVVLFYGNPAQMMRLIQALTYMTGERVTGNFGGKVECDEYLIAPYKSQAPRVVIPGNGERIFAMTQDDEMALAVPGKYIKDLAQGLKESGKAVGARYPVPPYQNFQPDFPKAHKELGKELGIL